MDTLLCDELLQEIFIRLSNSSSSSSSISLVSKRWLNLYRTSKSSLSLNIDSHQISQIQIFTSLLSHYPFLSSLSLTFQTPTTFSYRYNHHHHNQLDENDQYPFLTVIITSSSCSYLKHFKFLPSPISPSSLISLSKTCTHLISLNISISRPVFLNWVSKFRSLKTLTVSICDEFETPFEEFDNSPSWDGELALESVNLSGLRNDDSGICWLWRNCKKLRYLKLKSCEGICNLGSISYFDYCLKNIQEVELRTCRTIIDSVLQKLAENCLNLSSVLIYDGCSTESLLQFISTCRSTNIKKLDFRLPLDLNNEHLIAIAQDFHGLTSLRLESCCLVTGNGLKNIGSSMDNKIEELALINCDVIEREPGLLTTLGQNLKCLKVLDLSHNEIMRDKELVSMLVSCACLIDLKLRGCNGLSNITLSALLKCCKVLEKLDVLNCCGIDMDGVEFFVLNSKSPLRQVRVEEKKISSKSKTWASSKFIEFMFV